MQELPDAECISSSAGVLATVITITPKDLGDCPAAGVRNLEKSLQAISISCGGLKQTKVIELTLKINQPCQNVRKAGISSPVWRHYLPDGSLSWSGMTRCSAVMLDPCPPSISGWVNGRIHLSLMAAAAAVADVGLQGLQGQQGACQGQESRMPSITHFISLVSGGQKPAALLQEERGSETLLSELRNKCSRIMHLISKSHPGDPLGIDLQPDQSDAVLPAPTPHRPQLQLLQGPPGTGKTFTTAVMTWVRTLALMGLGPDKDVLVVLATATNAAIGELMKV